MQIELNEGTIQRCERKLRDIAADLRRGNGMSAEASEAEARRRNPELVKLAAAARAYIDTVVE